jgi:hypothetical protein
MSSTTFGSQIVYTKYQPGLPHSPDTAGIGVATMVNGAWSTSFLPNSIPRITPEGTIEDDDADPRVNYVKSDKTALYWRQMSLPNVEHVIPVADMTNGNARRWVPGTHKFIFQGTPRGATSTKFVDQIFTYDTDTGELEQLTNTPLGNVGCFMWRAPEYNNEYVFMTMPTLRQTITVYRKLPGVDRKYRWTIVKTIKPTPQLPYFFSPEPFVHNGRSYLMFQMSPSSKFFDKSIPTHVGYAGINPLVEDLRVLTANGPPRLRLDPEVFITAKGPFVYFNRLYPESDTHPAVNDGTWFVDTQLGPPKQ